MLEETIKLQLATHFNRLSHAVEITATIGEDHHSKWLHKLLNEIAALSDKITLREKGCSGGLIPSFRISRAGSHEGPVFSGSPMGSEFTSLILAILQHGGHPSREAQELQEQIRQISSPMIFETWYVTSCVNCAVVIQALNLMTALNQNIQHTAIDGGMFNKEAEEKGIKGVPTVFLNGTLFSEGRMTLADIVHKLPA